LTIQQGRTFLEKRKKDRGKEGCAERLGEENGKEERIKIPEGFRIESFDKEKKHESFRKGEQEDEQRPGMNAFKVDAVLKELRPVEEKGSGKSVQAEAISGEEVHEVAEDESNHSSGDGGRGNA
jgi:hypothetical protein